MLTNNPLEGLSAASFGHSWFSSCTWVKNRTRLGVGPASPHFSLPPPPNSSATQCSGAGLCEGPRWDVHGGTNPASVGSDPSFPLLSTPGRRWTLSLCLTTFVRLQASGLSPGLPESRHTLSLCPLSATTFFIQGAFVLPGESRSEPQPSCLLPVGRSLQAAPCSIPLPLT